MEGPNMSDIANQDVLDRMKSTLLDCIKENPSQNFSLSIKLKDAEVTLSSTPRTPAIREIEGPGGRSSASACKVRFQEVAEAPLKEDKFPSEAEAQETREKHVKDINLKIRNCGSLTVKHSFFLSHFQENAGDIAAILNLLLTSSTDLPCWFDQFAMHINLDGMVRGVLQSAVFLLILTKGVLLRPWVQLEIRTAMILNKKIALLFESDHRKSGYCASIEEYFEGAPSDIIEHLNQIEARPLRRKAYEQEALVTELVTECADVLLRANKQRNPMKVLQVDPHILGDSSDADLAACYVDLGSGQTMIYLFAIAEDSSLHYDLIFEDTSGCFLDKDPCARAEMRPEFIAKFASVAEKLHSYEGRSLRNLFSIFIGGTAKFRNAKKEDPAKVGAVESWFKGVIAESKICDAREYVPVTFNIIGWNDEARLEWLAIKQACLENLDEPHCVCSGGSGSLQGGMDNFYVSIDCDLAKGAEYVKEHGVASYQESLVQGFERTFSPLGNKVLALRGDCERLRIVLISSFYYAALACKIVQKGEYIYYRNPEDIIQPALAFLKDDSGGDKDKANVARMLKVLDAVTNRNYHNVEVLIVRDWIVRSKPYKATWLTGKFIETMKLKYLDEEMKRAQSKNELKRATLTPAEAVSKTFLKMGRSRSGSSFDGDFGLGNSTATDLDSADSD